MRYTVTWQPHQQDLLAQLWLAAPDRDEVRRAADSLEQMLARNPRAQAQNIQGELYELRVPPLAVAFYVSDDDRLVKIVGVRRLPKLET